MFYNNFSDTYINLYIHIHNLLCNFITKYIFMYCLKNFKGLNEHFKISLELYLLHATDYG